MTTTYQEIHQRVGDTHIGHKLVKADSIRLESNGTFSFTEINNNVIRDMYFSDGGIGTFNWLLAGNKIEKNKYDKNDFTYASFTGLNKEMRNEVGYKWHGLTITNRVIALCKLLKIDSYFIHYLGNEIRGITRNYNDDITGDDVLRAIVDNGLTHRLESYYVTETAQRFYLRASKNTYMVISNGYTGHEKLSYRVLTRFSDNNDKAYSFEYKFSSNKHLSKLQNTFDKLGDTLNTIMRTNLEDLLNAMTFTNFISGFSGYAEIDLEERNAITELLTGVDSQLDFIDETTIADVIAWSSIYASNNRKKSMFERVMNKYLTHLSSEMKV